MHEINTADTCPIAFSNPEGNENVPIAQEFRLLEKPIRKSLKFHCFPFTRTGVCRCFQPNISISKCQTPPAVPNDTGGGVLGCQAATDEPSSFSPFLYRSNLLRYNVNRLSYFSRVAAHCSFSMG